MPVGLSFLEEVMEEKHLLCESGTHRLLTNESLNGNHLSFEDRLFLEAIRKTGFPERLRQRRPKLFDRLQGRLVSLKKEVIKLYEKDQKKRRRCEQ